MTLIDDIDEARKLLKEDISTQCMLIICPEGFRKDLQPLFNEIPLNLRPDIAYRPAKFFTDRGYSPEEALMVPRPLKIREVPK